MENDLTLQEILKTIETDLSDPSIIQDNKIIFSYGDKVYRVRMPSQLEETLAQNAKSTLFGRLLVTDGYYFKDKLRQILKEKQNVDINELEEQKRQINIKIQDVQLSLAPKLDDEQKTIDRLRNKIIELQTLRIEFSIKINQYMSCSIEDSMEREYIQTLTAYCTEALDKDEEKESWSRVWKNVKEFQDDDSLFANKVMAYMSYLMLNVHSV